MAAFIWIGAVVLGNLFGRIIASIQGWDDFSYDRAGGVFYAMIQGSIGAYFAVIGSKSWLGDGRYARFWLGLFGWLFSGVIAIAIAYSVYAGRTELFRWNTLATIVFIAATEFVRRLPENEFG